MSEGVQVVTLSWREGDKAEPMKLWDVQDNKGRLNWTAVEETFLADSVLIVGQGCPALLDDGPWRGFTMDTFEAGSTTLVSVKKRAESSRNVPEWMSDSYPAGNNFRDCIESGEAECKAVCNTSLKEVRDVMEYFGFAEAHGEKVEPLQAPPTCIPEMPAFPFWEYPNKDAAAADFAKEHQEHLQSCGVKFERGGFSVRDIHDQSDLLALPVGSVCFEGGVDCAIVPFGITGFSVADHLRVGFRHMQQQEHKDLYAASHAIEGGRQEDATGRELEDHCPHAIVVLIAAAYVNNIPLDIVLTDGQENILLRFKEESVLKYSGLTRREVYYAVAQRLKEHEDMKIKMGRVPDEELDQLDSALTQAHRVLRQRLGNPGEALAEQLESLLSSTDSPAERFETTYDLFYAWASNMKGDPLGLDQFFNS